VDRFWSIVVERYSPPSQEMDSLVAQATAVGLGDKGAPLSAALAEAAKTGLGDPLSAAPGVRLARATQARLDRLTTQLGVLRERVGALVGIRDGYPRRMAELRALVDQVGA